MDKTTMDSTWGIGSRWGIRLQVMMDNGPQFTSLQIEQFK